MTLPRPRKNSETPGVTDETPAWATVEIRVEQQSDEAELPGSSPDELLLESFAYLLAELEGVGGVETRDAAGSFVSPLSCADDEDASQNGHDDAHEQAVGAWLRGSHGLIVYTTPAHIETLCEAAQDVAASLGLRLEIRTQVRVDDSWRDDWKKYYRTLRVGNGQLQIRPSWLPADPSNAVAELILDPGRAFGTGLHESTRLCLDIIASLARDAFPLSTVVDLGCGSGILGLAAARLFAASLRQLRFLDLDPEAVETTRENCEINSPLPVEPEFQVGHAGQLDGATFHLVLANIRPEILIPAASAITGAVAPGGALVLSGILDEEAERVTQAYVAQGLSIQATPRLRGWTGLLMRRNE